MQASPIFIGISGGSGSGKSTFAHALGQRLSADRNLRCSVLAQDSYYFDLLDQEAQLPAGESVNFDHPRSIDFELVGQHLMNLRQGRRVEVPQYCMKTHRRIAGTQFVDETDVVLVDGTLVLSQRPLHPLFDYMVFIDCDENLRFERRLHRDTRERGRTPESVHTQFHSQVKPMHDLFIEPSKSHANIVLPGDEPIEITVDRFLNSTAWGSRPGMRLEFAQETSRERFVPSAL
jgi:uridine kinase